MKKLLIIVSIVSFCLFFCQSCNDDDGNARVEVCNDGADNDGDGFIDCDDFDCNDDDDCSVEICNDGIDNDGDGFTDCEDNDCMGQAGC